MSAANIWAIDPGPTYSAWVRLQHGLPVEHGKEDNYELLKMLRLRERPAPVVAIEMIASYGMAVGREVFETCVWIGRFVEACEFQTVYPKLIYRRDVKLFHCNSAAAKDSNIRQALIDHYGGSKAEAIGVKAKPGPLYGIKADEWSALAIALYVEGRRPAIVAHEKVIPMLSVA